MTLTRSASIAGALLLAALATGCNPYIQDSSGREYLNRGIELSADTLRRRNESRDDDAFRARLRQAANVEPQLRLPTRIGIARIEGGRLTAIPAAEAEAWLKTTARLGPRWGEFVPISPLIAELVASEQGGARDSGRVAAAVAKLRLGTARQHVDVVLVYEVAGHANDNATLLSFTDLSIVGMFIVPTRHLKAEGFAAALLLDVRNGYPYGTATARADDANLVPNVGSDTRKGDLLRAARTAAVVKLAGEVEKMAAEIEARQARGGR